MIDLSRATMSNIWHNILVSLGLKAVFLVTTVLGVTGLWPAILADTGATVLVTLNALRLLRFPTAWLQKLATHAHKAQSSLRQNCGRSQSCKLSSEETSTDLIDLLARSQR